MHGAPGGARRARMQRAACPVLRAARNVSPNSVTRATWHLLRNSETHRERHPSHPRSPYAPGDAVELWRAVTGRAFFAALHFHVSRH